MSSFRSDHRGRAPDDDDDVLVMVKGQGLVAAPGGGGGGGEKGDLSSDSSSAPSLPSEPSSDSGPDEPPAAGMASSPPRPSGSPQVKLGRTGASAASPALGRRATSGSDSKSKTKKKKRKKKRKRKGKAKASDIGSRRSTRQYLATGVGAGGLSAGNSTFSERSEFSDSIASLNSDAGLNASSVLGPRVLIQQESIDRLVSPGEAAQLEGDPLPITVDSLAPAPSDVRVEGESSARVIPKAKDTRGKSAIAEARATMRRQFSGESLGEGAVDPSSVIRHIYQHDVGTPSLDTRYEYRLHGAWRGASAGGPPGAVTFGSNPQILFNLRNVARMKIGIRRVGSDSAPGATIGVMVVATVRGGAGPRVVGEPEAKAVMFSEETVADSGEWPTVLEPAALPYALVAFTDAPGAQGEFVVTVESGEVVTFEAMPPLVTAEDEARRLAAREYVMGLAGQEREPVFEPGREWVPGASYPGLYGDDETTFALLRAEHSGSHDGAPGEGEEVARLAAAQAMSTTAAADRASCAVEDSPLEKNWYIRYFLGRPHVNYIGLDENGDPMVISVINERVFVDDDGLLVTRVIVWESKEISHHLLTARTTTLRDVASFAAPNISDRVLTFRKVRDTAALEEELVRLEDTEYHEAKMGVLYAAAGQETELEMFNNEHGSEAFETFLGLLGDRVPLRGYQGYTAQLDTTQDLDGTHMIRRRLRGTDIVFHVSTYLHYDENDQQQVQRKRHIGNDIVVIVFMDGDTPYKASTMRSQYTQVLAVVQATPVEGLYRVEFGGMVGLPPFGPSSAEFFVGDAAFVEHLLTRCLNGSRATVVGDEFHQRAKRVRAQYLAAIHRRFFKRMVAVHDVKLRLEPIAMVEQYQRVTQALHARPMAVLGGAVSCVELVARGQIMIFVSAGGVMCQRAGDNPDNRVLILAMESIVQIVVVRSLDKLLIRTSNELLAASLSEVEQVAMAAVTERGSRRGSSSGKHSFVADRVPNTGGIHVLEVGTIGDDTFVCAACGSNVMILRSVPVPDADEADDGDDHAGFEVVQSLTAPNVPLFVRLTPRGLVMAHESTFTLFELGPDASLVHINTLYCCKLNMNPRDCFVTGDGHLLLCYESYGVLLDPETTKPIRQTTRAFQWLDVPLYFLLVADRLVVVTRGAVSVHARNGARLETHYLGRNQNLAHGSTNNLVVAMDKHKTRLVYSLEPLLRPGFSVGWRVTGGGDPAYDARVLPLLN